MQQYTNLTIAESITNLQKPPTDLDLSKAIVDTPYKTINVTINGTISQIKYSNATIDGRSFVKICMDGGFDPFYRSGANSFDDVV